MNYNEFLEHILTINPAEGRRALIELQEMSRAELQSSVWLSEEIDEDDLV